MRTLAVKAHGEDVAVWQTFLINQGLLAANGADGEFGPKTEQATKTYQSNHSLHIDGIVGPNTIAAATGDGFVAPPAPAMPDVLHEVHPELARRVAQLLDETAQHNIESVIVDAYRSFEEQTAIFNQGRTTPGAIISNAHAGESYHNYGLAVDIASKRNGQTMWTEHDAKVRGPIGQRLGLEWGGAWKGFVDLPHFQLTTGLSVKQCKELYTQHGNSIQAVWNVIDQRLASGPRGLGDELGDEVE